MSGRYVYFTSMDCLYRVTRKQWRWMLDTGARGEDVLIPGSAVMLDVSCPNITDWEPVNWAFAKEAKYV